MKKLLIVCLAVLFVVPVFAIEVTDPMVGTLITKQPIAIGQQFVVESYIISQTGLSFYQLQFEAYGAKIISIKPKTLTDQCFFNSDDFRVTFQTETVIRFQAIDCTDQIDKYVPWNTVAEITVELTEPYAYFWLTPYPVIADDEGKRFNIDEVWSFIASVTL